MMLSGLSDGRRVLYLTSEFAGVSSLSDSVSSKLDRNCFHQLQIMKLSSYALLLLLLPVVYCDLQNACCAKSVSVSDLLREPACAAMVGAAGIISIVAAPLALAAAGFGAVGIGAGTVAATWQSTSIAGTAFSALQSAGMAGVALGTKAVIGSTAAVAAVNLCCAAVTCQKNWRDW